MTRFITEGAFEHKVSQLAYRYQQDLAKLADWNSGKGESHCEETHNSSWSCVTLANRSGIVLMPLSVGTGKVKSYEMSVL
jgi:hypothetical protein